MDVKGGAKCWVRLEPPGRVESIGSGLRAIRGELKVLDGIM